MKKWVNTPTALFGIGAILLNVAAWNLNIWAGMMMTGLFSIYAAIVVSMMGKESQIKKETDKWGRPD